MKKQEEVTWKELRQVVEKASELMLYRLMDDLKTERYIPGKEEDEIFTRILDRLYEFDAERDRRLKIVEDVMENYL